MIFSNYYKYWAFTTLVDSLLPVSLLVARFNSLLMHSYILVVFVYYALTLWDNVPVQLWGMETAIKCISATSDIIFKAWTIFFLMTQFLIWGLSAFYASSAPRGELQLLFFLFLLQHFFSLSRVLFARCVASLLCVQLLAVCFIFY